MSFYNLNAFKKQQTEEFEDDCSCDYDIDDDIYEEDLENLKMKKPEGWKSRVVYKRNLQDQELLAESETGFSLSSDCKLYMQIVRSQ